MLTMRQFARFLPIWLLLAGTGCRSSAIEGPPAELLAEGRRLYAAKEYSQARRHFKGVRKYHAAEPQAEEALLEMARCEVQTGDGEDAFDDFKQMIDDYPNTRFAVDIANGLFELGNNYLNGDVDTFLFFSASRAQGVQVLEHMQIHFRHHGLADDALLAVALFHIDEGQFRSAVETLRQLIADYPRSEHILRARYELAGALLRQSRGALYDVRTLHGARGRFRDFVAMVEQRGQQERYRKEVAAANKQIRAITATLAERQYEIGRFYERTENPGSAAHHYRLCILNYKGTEAAGNAQTRLGELAEGSPAAGAAKNAEKKAG